LVEKKESGLMKKRDILLIIMKPLTLKALMIEMMMRTITQIEETEVIVVEEEQEVEKLGVEVDTKTLINKKGATMIKIIKAKENMVLKEVMGAIKEIMEEEEEITDKEIMMPMKNMDTIKNKMRTMIKSSLTKKEQEVRKMKVSSKILLQTMKTSQK
jgi:hypothetical protein